MLVASLFPIAIDIESKESILHGLATSAGCSYELEGVALMDHRI